VHVAGLTCNMLCINFTAMQTGMSSDWKLSKGEAGGHVHRLLTTQPVRSGRPYNLYHGTLEARPVTATTSKRV